MTPGQRTVAAALRVMGRRERDYARWVLNRAGSAHPAGAVAPAPGWWRRPTDLRHRRDPAASRRQDQGAGHLPRPGAFQPVSGGQGQRPALDLPGGWATCPGPDAIGPCRCSRCWRLRPVTTNSRDASTRSSPTGPARWSCNCAAGCRSDPWCWWATTAMPCWICSTAARSLRDPVTLIARLRLDAALYAPAPPRQPGQNGRPPLKGPRRPPSSLVPTSMPRTSRCPRPPGLLGIDPRRHHHADVDDAAALPNLLPSGRPAKVSHVGVG